jgi:ribosomal protein S18 acetylase RimI-like enzyme
MSSSQIHLRRAAASDLDAILALERATDHAPHWPLAAYRAILAPAEAPHLTAAIERCLFVAENAAVGNAVQTAAGNSASDLPHEEVQTTERLVGFAVGLLHPADCDPAGSGTPERVAELESVAVALDARRSGIGRALCCAVVDWCRAQGATEVVLEVRATSVAAVGLYASLGFIPAGRRPRYYRDPDDDALILRLRWS